MENINMDDVDKKQQEQIDKLEKLIKDARAELNAIQGKIVPVIDIRPYNIRAKEEVDRLIVLFEKPGCKKVTEANIRRVFALKELSKKL